MAFPTGSRLGPYEILSAIGAGGMGEVYRARDSKLGRDVAIKVLPDVFARDAERLARFQREAKLLASLNHSNIASIYGLEDSAATHALVMELAEGPTLADRIAHGPLPIEDAVRIARQICEALEYAHEKGIIHRDLKPTNIKVAPDGTVKILDFGLAKAMEMTPEEIANSPTLSRMATQAGVLLGTAAYMSPEQAKGRPVDRRADIWAFGCVLYEMLTRKMAFPGESVTDTLAAVIRAEPDWSQLPVATPARVRVLLQRCLQKDPRQRLQAIGDARISLDEVLSGAPEPTPSAAPPVSVASWRRMLPWAAADVLAVVAASFAFLHFRETPAAPTALMRFTISAPENTTALPTVPFALSPDGRHLVFMATNPDGRMGLWIRSLDSLEARPIPGSEWSSSANSLLFWSPDSRYIAFAVGGELRKIDVSGGPAQELCQVRGGAIGGSWSRDGVIIIGTGGGGLMRVSENGGTAEPVTTLDPSRKELIHGFPTFLPDERHFIYFRDSSNPENRGVYIGSLDAKPAEQSLNRLMATTDGPAYVPPSGASSGHVLFLRHGVLLAQPFDARRLELTGEPVSLAEHIGTFLDYGFISASSNGVLVYRTAGGGQSRLTWLDQQGLVATYPPEPIEFQPAVWHHRSVVLAGGSNGKTGCSARGIGQPSRGRSSDLPASISAPGLAS